MNSIFRQIILIDEEYDYNLSLIEFLQSNTPSGWKEFFSDTYTILQKVSDKLVTISNKIIYPPIDKVFRVFYDIPLDKIKVVILGQDPYHNGSATGLAFSVKKGEKINPSLRNIAKEVANCGFSVNKNSGDLSSWAKQGVFLINTSLTVEESSPASHLKDWKDFTIKLIQYISTNSSNIVFLLWGEKAQKYKEYIETINNNFIIETSHPSPFSARKGFLGSKCFSVVNSFLSSNEKEIDWSIM